MVNEAVYVWQLAWRVNKRTRRTKILTAMSLTGKVQDMKVQDVGIFSCLWRFNQQKMGCKANQARFERSELIYMYSEACKSRERNKRPETTLKSHVSMKK
jgi:hypothetical protein